MQYSFRKSAINGEDEETANTTPVPITSKGNTLGINLPEQFTSMTNSRMNNHNKFKSAEPTEELKSEDSESSDSNNKTE